MSRQSKKSMGGTTVLILFGLIVLFTGTKALIVLIPAAMLVWYGAGLTPRSSRN